MKLSEISRIPIGFYPTPLHEMKQLTKQLQKARLWIKRDDLTGIGGGGNKLRKLEFIVKDALDKGYTTLLTYGGIQTNHGRLTAAAASLYGMKSIIMCYGQPPERMSGNLVLDRMFGAEIVFMDTTEVRTLPREKQAEGYYKLRDESTAKVVKRYEDQGDKVYMVPIGGHSPLGTLGYFYAVKEILDQCNMLGINPSYLVTGHGSGGTYAGLLLGAKYFKAPFSIKGISVSQLQTNAIQKMVEFVNAVSIEFELGVHFEEKDIDIDDTYAGIGYNLPDNQTREAMYHLARTEGLIVDPCYTGKAFRAFLNLVEKSIIPPFSDAIFLHTGGMPGIWTNEHEDAMQKDLWVNQYAVY